MLKSVNDAAIQDTVAVASGGAAVVGVNTKFARDVKVGDELVIEGVAGPTTTGMLSFIVATVTDDTNLVLSSNFVGTSIVATSSYYIVTRDLQRNPQGHNVVYGLYQPPLGIFDHTGHIGSGDFKLSLNPNVYYKQACVQTFKNNATAGTDYTLNILDIKLYIYTEKVSIPDSIQTLNMYELNVQNKMYADNLQFQIPSSTQKICVFLQNNDANSNSKYPPSYFGTTDNLDLKIQSMQLSYRGQQKTSTTYQSYFVSRGDTNPAPAPGQLINQLQQRYLETYTYLDPESSKSLGCESFSDWLEREYFLHSILLLMNQAETQNYKLI